jgi:hypothetical protein
MNQFSKKATFALLLIFVLVGMSQQAWSAPCPSSGYSSVLLRGTNVDNNLSLTPHWSGGDGNTSSTSAGDQECRSTVGNYMYFRVADTWMLNCNQTMYLEVTYYDDKTSSNLMQPQYDSTTAAYTAGSNWNFANSGRWRTATWTLSNCLFNNRQNNGSDLRVYTSATVTKWASVRISTVAFNETNFPTASWMPGSNEQYHGILHPMPSDGTTSITTQGGRSCRLTSSKQYMYFNVADSIWYNRTTAGKNLYLKVVYFDNGTGAITPQYDSTSSEYTSTTPITRTNSNTWKTATWTLSDIRFGNRQNGSADFRLDFGSVGSHYIAEIYVSKDEFPVEQDTTPPSVPTNVQAGGTQPTIRKVTWNASTDDIGVAGYKVWRNGEHIASTTSLFYLDIDRTPSTTYSYQVSAYDAVPNESNKSAVAATTTPAITNFPIWRWDADNLTGTVGSRTSNFTDGGETYFTEWRSGTDWNWTLDSGNGWITGTSTGGRGFLQNTVGHMAHGFDVNTGVTITARVKPINPSSNGTLRFIACNDSTTGLNNVGGGISGSTDLAVGWDTGNQIVFFTRSAAEVARWNSTVPFTNQWTIWTLSAKRSGNSMVWKMWVNGEYQNTLTYQFNSDWDQAYPISAISIGRRNTGGTHETVWDWVSITNAGEIEAWDGAGGAVPSIKAQTVANQTKCEGESVTWKIDAMWGDTAGRTYQWKKWSGSSWVDVGTNSNTFTINPISASNAGQYKCTISNNYGSCDSNTATLTVNPLPSITSHPSNQTKCDGETATFSVTASNVTSYVWQVSTDGGSTWTDTPTGYGARTATYAPPVTSADNGKKYRCAVTNSCGTVYSDAATLTVNPLPVAPTSASNNGPVCAGQSATLSYSGGSGTTLKWYSGSCGGTYVGSGQDLSVSPSATTTYYCRWENDCGESTCESTTVTVNALPAAPTSASNNGPICEGGSATLSYSGGSGDELKWYSGSCGGTYVGSGQDLSVSPSATTTYYCRWENDCGESSCESTTVTVNALPGTPTNAQATPSAICSGDSSTLSASVGEGEEVEWFEDSCGGTPLTSPVSPTSTTTYYARAKNTTTGCISSSCAEVTVTVVESPTAPTSASANPDAIAAGQSATLSYVGGSGSELKWYSGSCGGTYVGSGQDLSP